jgi:DNA-directed RNA polymerase delta subunit
LQDPRFTYIGDKKWRLREFLSDDQINNISESLYDIQIEGNVDENKTKSIIENEIDEEFEEAAEENETNSEL